MTRRPCLIVALFLALSWRMPAQIVASGFNSVTASVANNGTWSVNLSTTGWRFAGSLGTSALAPHILTGSDRAADIASAVDAGANGYQAKPSGIDELVEMFRSFRAIGRHQIFPSLG